jgi:hypothetical protein
LTLYDVRQAVMLAAKRVVLLAGRARLMSEGRNNRGQPAREGWAGENKHEITAEPQSPMHTRVVGFLVHNTLLAVRNSVYIYQLPVVISLSRS